MNKLSNRVTAGIRRIDELYRGPAGGLFDPDLAGDFDWLLNVGQVELQFKDVVNGRRA